jgi:hypothetical protein
MRTTPQSRLEFILILCLALGQTACSVTAPIQPARSSKSAFEGKVYKGTTVTVAEGVADAERYRVFQQGATGFVSMQSVRETAEQRANDFCRPKGKVMESLQETISSPPYIFGNFPRIEIVFDCFEVGRVVSDSQQTKYMKLTDLKKLLDSHVITPEEFEREKAKVFNQP